MPARLRSAPVALALWIALAVVVWNVVFDRVLVLAGRRYAYAAARAARVPEAYLRVDDWMRPAAARGVRLASVAAGLVLAVGLVAVPLAARSKRDSRLL